MKAAIFIITGFIFFYVTSNTYATTLWKYQCIDTMKISRDKARGWASNQDLETHINWEMETVKNMGGNCVAIDTPYDEEFLPYLNRWVNAAHKKNLHIWFRGNFSGWEGWFDYSKNVTSKILFEKTRMFIIKHPDLFKSGDIFTPAPEAENGGEFNQVAQEQYGAYRKFLIDEYKTAKDSFATIGKNVSVNWLSMNGGLARRMMDQETINAIDHLVTIDHYIKTPQEMTDYITYFNNTFHAKVVVGEFGAPIPDINGNMTEEEQANFVRSVFTKLYINKNSVMGVNYWDLYDGSTALINYDDKTPRKVTQVIKDYFIPATLTGHAQDTLGEPLQNIAIKMNDTAATVTNSNGDYTITIPANTLFIENITGKNYTTVVNQISGKNGETVIQNATLSPKQTNWVYATKLFFRNLVQKLRGE